MLNGPIPPHVDPRKLADRGAVLEGEIPLASLPRLAEQMVDHAGTVRAKLSFERDERRAVVIHGEFSVEAKMVCQRCLDVATLPIHGEYHYAVIPEGSKQVVPKGYDALEVGEDPLDLLTLVEDELLLALPIVPVHDSSVCQQPAGQDDPQPSEDEVSRPNPFSVLAQLKRDPNV
ncbi:YceD family protein [Pseudomonas flexibilis]|uniref:Large ribosomal RNA subunit accumulation protein YceD n=1 Tax=Pseudomonas flexibilis TaxID=706570 RepID=A0A0B3BZ50_9PSED|nr:YceD family protein [Pseudomonas flexibilis]KHO66346.1 metal-binding protein [Pseudomonas flexibilis]SCY48983.1 uncharacterized protein SAMN02927929_03032 [Pseudomonas flexibilis]